MKRVIQTTTAGLLALLLSGFFAGASLAMLIQMMID